MRKRRNKRNRSPVARTKKTDWERSNAAHDRLERKASNEWLDAYPRDNKGMINGWIKRMYHADVSKRQNRLKRKLTAQEKKDSYDFAVFWVEDETRFWKK